MMVGARGAAACVARWEQRGECAARLLASQLQRIAQYCKAECVSTTLSGVRGPQRKARRSTPALTLDPGICDIAATLP